MREKRKCWFECVACGKWLWRLVTNRGPCPSCGQQVVPAGGANYGLAKEMHND